MPLPSSGALSLNDIATFFGGSQPISLSQYYAGGGIVPSGTTGTNGPVPTSGTITVANFYGVTIKHQQFITSGVSYTLPSNWNPSNNLVECIGGGGNGNSGASGAGPPGNGGPGGGYASVTNLNIAAGTTMTVSSGIAADTWISSTGSAPTSTSQGVLAQGGSSGSTQIGSVTYTGGTAGPYGGGAAGPNGNGAGNVGDAGYGGAAGSLPSGTGGSGTEYGSYGSGGGGGYGSSSAGGTGGSYGGGGGGGSSPGSYAGGTGTRGLIVLTWYA